MRSQIIILISITFYSYVAWIWYKFGILPSISQSYYKVIPKWLFPAFCLIVGIGSFIIGWIDSSILLSISGGALVIVGVLPEIKIPFIKERHIIAAIISIIFSQLAIGIDYHLWPINIMFLIFAGLLMIFKKSVKEIWYIEILAFTIMVITLIY